MASSDPQILLARVLETLRVTNGPNSKGDYTAWCPFHADGQGKPPHQPNLSVSTRGFFCHACNEKGSIAKLARHLGITTGRGDPQAIYNYQDENGRLLYQVLRYPGKSFLQRRPDGIGGWIWNLRGVPRVLYNYPELLARPTERVFIVEGEKDVETLMAIGLLATTNSGGAGKWRDSYSKCLKGRDIAILPDNDEPGLRHAHQIVNSLLGKARSIKILELSGLKDKGDVSDWLSAGHTAKELIEISNNCPIITSPFKIPKANSWQEDVLGTHLTDLGNAQRLVALHGTDLHYCHPWKRWLIWDGTRWKVDDTAEIERRARDTIRKIFFETASEEDPDIRKKLCSHALASESAYKLKAMTALAASEAAVPILPSDLDSDGWLLNCRNGTLDLRTGELSNHNRANLITKILPVEYNPLADCPMWNDFLQQIMNRNTALIDFLQRAVGYTLTGDITEQCLFILYGSGSNGKTTFIETLMALIADYAIKTPSESLMLKHGDSIPNDIARLKGARMVAACEAELGRRFAESLLKQLTGGDVITARFLHQEFFDFTPCCKIWFATNHRPIIKGSDYAIWRRLRLIPFNVTIPEDDQDKGLPVKLLKELPGILTWAVEGCCKWQEKGLGPPDEVRIATAQYRDEMDTLGAFISDCCIISAEATAQATPLYNAYCKWSNDHGEQQMTSTAFGRQLSERGHEKRKDTKGKKLTHYYGLGLIDESRKDG